MAIVNDSAQRLLGQERRSNPFHFTNQSNGPVKDVSGLNAIVYEIEEQLSYVRKNKILHKFSLTKHFSIRGIENTRWPSLAHFIHYICKFNTYFSFHDDHISVIIEIVMKNDNQVNLYVIYIITPKHIILAITANQNNSLWRHTLEVPIIWDVYKCFQVSPLKAGDTFSQNTRKLMASSAYLSIF